MRVVLLYNIFRLFENKTEYYGAPGEAAFYAPKLDFMAKDSIGREWQVATIQLDVNMPDRFDLFCINEKGEKERIVMIHAAIMGSIERFISIIIEHYAGAFPLWLSPVQVKVVPVRDTNNAVAETAGKRLTEAGLRVDIDTSDVGFGWWSCTFDSIAVPPGPEGSPATMGQGDGSSCVASGLR